MKDECPNSEIVVIFQKQDISEDNAANKGSTAAMDVQKTKDSQIATEVAADPQTKAPVAAESKKGDEVLAEGVAVDTAHTNEEHQV